MSDAFSKALSFTLAQEGGYQNLRSDPGNRATNGVGGGTNFGITQKTYDAYYDALDLSYKPVRYITPREVRTIYQLQYWRPSGAQMLADTGKPTTAVVLFDWAVHGGVKKARTFTQAALHVTPDSVWGPRTLDTLAKADDTILASELLRLRVAHHWVRCRGDEAAREVLVAARLPQVKGIWPQYSETARDWLKGWLNRARGLAESVDLPLHPSFASGAEQGTYPSA